MKYLYLITISTLLISCKVGLNFQGIYECTYENGKTKLNKFSFSDFEIQFPDHWEIHNHQEGDKASYHFVTTIDSANILTVSDEEFNKRYNNFSTLILNKREPILKHNIESEFNNLLKKVKNDSTKTRIEIGQTSYNQNDSKWIQYIDNTYLKDNLTCIGLVTWVNTDNLYLFINAQIIGEEDKEVRKCELIDILKTLEIKDYR